jgi:O-antigen/teichoic acid export membrane protein
MLRPRILDLAISALFLLLPLLMFFPQTLGGRTLIPTENLYQYEPYRTYREVVQAPTVPHNHLVSDLVLQNYMWKWFAVQQVKQGEIPLWNPHQFSGIPFLAAGQHTMLYPLSIVYYVLDLPAAYGWFTVRNLWLAGVCMYAFGRVLGISRTGATIAGVVYQLGGFVLASVVFQMMIGAVPWLPLLLLMIELILREKPLWGTRYTPLYPLIGGAVALMLNILAGHVEITLYTLLIAGYYAAGRLIQIWWLTSSPNPLSVDGEGGRVPFRQLLWKAFYLLAMVALGFGLGALQFLPLFEFVQGNWRSARADLGTVLSYAHPFRDVVQFILPNFYGNPSHHSYFDVFTGATVTDLTNAAGQPITFIEWGMKNYVEGALYLGILPLLLAVWGVLTSLFNWRSNQRQELAKMQSTTLPLSVNGEGAGGEVVVKFRGETLIFASLGSLSLSFMFGLPTYALVYGLPGFNQLNSPFRWIYALTVCVALLAALGWDNLGRFPRIQRRFGFGMLLAGGLVLLALGASWAFFGQVEPLLERLIGSLAKADEAFANARAFYSYQVPQVAIFGVLLCLSGMIFSFQFSVFSSQHSAPSTSPSLPAERGLGGEVALSTQSFALALFAVVVIAADLMLASWNFNPASDPELLKFVPPSVQFLLNQQAAGERFRFTTLDDPAQAPILNANSGWRYGLEDIRGYDSIIPRQYVDYMRAVAPQGQLDFNRIAPLFTQDLQGAGGANPPGVLQTASPLLDWLNVRYILTHRSTNLYPRAGQAAWTIAHEDEALRIWANPNAVPRAFTLDDADFDPVWLTPPQQPVDYAALNASPAPTRYTAVPITRDSGREKFLAVRLAAESWLIVSESWAAGWRAFVRPLGAGEAQETPYEVQRVVGNLQAVRLPAGAWTVRLVYSPTSFQVSLFGSIISVGIVVLLLGMAIWRGMVGNGDRDSTTARVARNSLAPILLNLFNRGVDFALLIVILRILSPQEVGTYYYLVVVFVWFDIFSNFGLDLFLMREIARDKARAGHYFYNITLLRLWLCVIGIALLIGFLLVRQATVQPPLNSEALLTIGLLYAGLFPASLSKGMSSLFYAYEQAEKPEAIATITTINKAIFNVVVLVLGFGIVGMAGVSIANNFITLGVLVYSGRHLIGKITAWRPDVPLLRGMLRESYPLLLNHFLATIFLQIDVIILEAFHGAETVAQYSVAYRWLLAINIVPALFTRALLPVMSRQATEDLPALQRTYTFGIKLLFALAVPAAIAFTVLAVPLTYLMGGQQYLPHGAIAIQVMMWSIPIGWMNSLTQYALVAVDLQRYITRAFFAAVLFNIITNMLLIPQYSYPAAALTTIASELVLFIFFGWLMQQGVQGRLVWFGMIGRTVAAGLVMLAVTLLLWQWLPYGALLVGSVVYGGVLWALRPLTDEERALLRQRLPARAARWV